MKTIFLSICCLLFISQTSFVNKPQVDKSSADYLVSWVNEAYFNQPDSAILLLEEFVITSYSIHYTKLYEESF